MSADEKPVHLTPGEAMSVIAPGDQVHCFANNAVGMLIGADWDRDDVQEAMDAAKNIQIAGGMARRMKHGVVLPDKRLFFATDESALAALETKKVSE